MSTPYWRPHEGPTPQGAHAPNAALLIDFDNVTMGMRSDLAKELKSLLDSDIIKGKVTVQRAYADWRRYPQYIVPLSEASIDLIFAPAYGSSKKNATDIRMAIDGMELVFIRPEIGTFILLTGDSDFSSLVLKLKEYGKYVIGIGIEESSSDILVQNCDEYYSYTSIAGLRKTTDMEHVPKDPWTTVSQSLDRMVNRGDVMRSDRLKQVILEIDPGFDEKSYGFSKFSRFLTEASSKGLVSLKKLENGQYELAQPSGRSEKGDGRGRKSDGRKGRGDRDDRKGRRDRGTAEEAAAPAAASEEGGQDPLAEAYELLRTTLSGFAGNGREAVRDSDVKRKMLDLSPSFDEAELGFGKFSRFLKQAHEHGVVVMVRRDTGNYEVSLADGPPPGPDGAGSEAGGAPAAPTEAPEPEAAPSSRSRRAVGARRGSVARRKEETAPPLLEGQVVQRSARAQKASAVPPAAAAGTDVSGLGLPTEPNSMVRYLTGRYKGVGQKTAETLVGALGSDMFSVFQDTPERLATIVPRGRADQILEAWRADFGRRTGAVAAEAAESLETASIPEAPFAPEVASAPEATSAPETTSAPEATSVPDEADGGGGPGARRTRRGTRRGSSRRGSSGR